MPRDEYRLDFTGDAQDLTQAAGQSEQALKGVNEQTERAGSAASEASEQGKGLGSAFGDLLGKARDLAAGLVGAFGLASAFSSVRQEMEENRRAAREFAEEMLDLQFLSQSFDEQERRFVGQAAEVAGRRPGEVARAFGGLKSFFPGLGDQELQGLFLEVAETARTTSAPLTTLTEAFQGIYAEVRDPQVAQNILRATIIQAGRSDPAVISNVLGKFLGPGQQIGGLDAATAAGFTAASTGLDTRAPEEQVTGLRSLLLALSGDLSDEQRALVDQGGIDLTNFETALNTLGSAIGSGRLSRTETAQLIPAEAIATATALADPSKRSEFFGKVDAVRTAAASEVDLTADAIRRQFGADERAALNFFIKRLEAEREFLQATDAESLEDLRTGAAKLLLDVRARERGVGPLGRFAQSTAATLNELLGASPEAIIEAGAKDLPGFFSPIFRPGEAEAAQAELLTEFELSRRGQNITINNTNIGQWFQADRPPGERRYPR